jgi:uncharacterized protein with PQ loop repeat
MATTVFAVSSSIPQIIKALKKRKTDDVSIWLVVVLIIGLRKIMGNIWNRHKRFT